MIVLCALVFTAGALFAGDSEIYLWVDEGGVVHFADQPQSDTKLTRPRDVGPGSSPLPANAVSVYLTTLSTGINWDTQKISGRFTLALKARDASPSRLFLEAHFPNPAREGDDVVVRQVARSGAPRIQLQSPALRGFDCKSYHVTIRVFDASDRDRQIGTHHQFIRSSVDLSRVRNQEQFLSAIFYGNCGSR
jgi:hypothetical protein